MYLEGLKTNPYLIQFIDTPSREVKQYVFDKLIERCRSEDGAKKVLDRLLMSRSHQNTC
jgi:hypothetical protein